jgi:hypothetical protein
MHLGTDMKGDNTMPKYISLVNFTQKGIENIKEVPHNMFFSAILSLLVIDEKYMHEFSMF